MQETHSLNDEPNSNMYQSKTNRLGRRFINGQALPMATRQQIINLHQNGMRLTDISNQLLVSHGCVSKILSKYELCASILPGRFGRRKWPAHLPGDRFRRPRTRYNREQTRILEEFFNSNQFPSAEQKLRLCQTIRVDYSSVQTWFSNRRSKARRIGETLPINLDPTFDTTEMTANQGQISETQMKTYDAQNCWHQQYMPNPTNSGVETRTFQNAENTLKRINVSESHAQNKRPRGRSQNLEHENRGIMMNEIFAPNTQDGINLVPETTGLTGYENIRTTNEGYVQYGQTLSNFQDDTQFAPETYQMNGNGYVCTTGNEWPSQPPQFEHNTQFAQHPPQMYTHEPQESAANLRYLPQEQLIPNMENQTHFVPATYQMTNDENCGNVGYEYCVRPPQFAPNLQFDPNFSQHPPQQSVYEPAETAMNAAYDQYGQPLPNTQYGAYFGSLFNSNDQ